MSSIKPSVGGLQKYTSATVHTKLSLFWKTQVCVFSSVKICYLY